MTGKRRKVQPKPQPGVAARPWDTSGFKRVSARDRAKMVLSCTINRFWRRREDNRLQSRVGPGCCRHCGSEPCGGGWGPMFGEHSARCCDKCHHEPVKGWRPTHVLWHGKKAFFVKEQPIGRAGSLYLRQDGVAWFCRIGDVHYFLGVELSPAEFARFKVADPHGWPAGVKAADVGVGVELPEDSDDEDEEYDDSDDGEDEDDDSDDGEDDAEDDSEEEVDDVGDEGDDAEDDGEDEDDGDDEDEEGDEGGEDGEDGDDESADDEGDDEDEDFDHDE